MTIALPTSALLHLPFEALAWACAVGAAWLANRTGLTPADWRQQTPPGAYLLCLAIGAILGAYIAGTLPDILRGQIGLGHSLAGALLGGIIGVELYKHFTGMTRSTGGNFVLPLTVGIVIGRWGCLFAGMADQTFGTPSDLPWAVMLEDGIARHPVQAYESLAMLAFLIVFLIALHQRARWAVGYGFQVMVIYYGTQRFIWEFLKPYPTVIDPLNSFHLICAALVIYGLGWIAFNGTKEAPHA